MPDSPKSLLTKRQVEVLKMRSQGLTQMDVARHLKTTRENVNILESRAHRNIRRAAATLELLGQLNISTQLTIMPETHILDIPKLILEKADEANIKIKGGCIEILERIGSLARDKIVEKHVVKPLTVSILPDGNFIVECF